MAGERKRTEPVSEQAPGQQRPRLQGPERSLRAAALFLSRANGFRLCTAIYGNPLRRDFWIDRLKSDLAERGTLLTVLDFTTLAKTGLLHGLRDHLLGQATPAGQRRVVAVIGLESRLPVYTDPTGPHRESNPFLAEANLDRELFLRHAPVPVVLWLTATGEGALSREAPDLWHWRAHSFNFEEEAAYGTGGQPLGIAQLESAGPGTVYRNREELERAAAVFSEGLRASLQAHGPGHPSTCRARLNLGNVLQQLGDLRRAVELFRENLVELERQSDVTVDDLSPTLNSLGIALRKLGSYAEAEVVLRRALKLNEDAFGETSERVAPSLNNLAQLLRATSRLAEAEPLMRRALKIGEKGYGADHSNVAIQLSNLAQLLKATNRLAEAEPLMRRALKIDQESYGGEHPKVAIRLSNLAMLLRETNRVAEAESLMRRVLKIDEESYGGEHPEVARDLNNLAQLLQATNRLAEAEPLMRRALEIDERSYGGQHPEVARDFNNLARLLQDTNRLVEAEPLIRRAFEIVLQSSARAGHDLPILKVVRGNFARILKDLDWSPERIDAEIAKMVEKSKKQVVTEG